MPDGKCGDCGKIKKLNHSGLCDDCYLWHVGNSKDSAPKGQLNLLVSGDLAEVKAKYNELIMAVANKWPGETRHETALRYIIQAETGSDQACAASSD